MTKDKADAPKAAEAQKSAEAAKPEPKRSAYVVTNGPICPNGGHASKGFQTGDVVELTASQAKHYMKLGRLAPFIEDDESEAGKEGG